MNNIIIEQIEVRLIECGIHRILLCIEKLTNEQLQFRPNTNSNSINNQILHLNGNVRQWLIASLSNAKDIRKRDEEFDTKNQLAKDELVAILIKLEKDIIIHVIEHFSYHLGQITYITKMLLDIDTGYYADLDLNEVN